jgi:hypothetical protein
VLLPELPPMADYLFTSYFLNEVLRNRRIEAEAA